MAFASALNTPKGLHCLTLPSSRNERPPTNLILPRQFPARFSSTLAFARRRNQRTEVASSKPKINKVRNELFLEVLSLFVETEISGFEFVVECRKAWRKRK